MYLQQTEDHAKQKDSHTYAVLAFFVKCIFSNLFFWTFGSPKPKKKKKFLVWVLVLGLNIQHIRFMINIRNFFEFIKHFNFFNILIYFILSTH